MTRPSRSRHCSSSAADSSGRPPGSSSTSPISASVSAGSTRSPARSAGHSIARRSSSRRIGPTSTWWAPTSRPSRSCARALPVEVGAHGQHDLTVVLHAARRGRPSRSRGVAADREDLLELVDDEQVGAVERRGVLAGADDPHRPALRAGERAARERRQQSGAHRRRLAAPGRTDDGEQRRADQPRDELGHEPLAAEEVLRVRGVEGAEAHVGTDRRGRHVVLGLLERPAHEHVAGEIVLGGAQLGTPVRGAPGAGRGRPFRRLAAGGARVAVALVDDRGDRRCPRRRTRARSRRSHRRRADRARDRGRGSRAGARAGRRPARRRSPRPACGARGGRPPAHPPGARTGRAPA